MKQIKILVLACVFALCSSVCVAQSATGACCGQKKECVAAKKCDKAVAKCDKKCDKAAAKCEKKCDSKCKQGKCYGSTLELPKCIAKGDDVCSLRYHKKND